MQYLISPRRAGTFEIPAIIVSVNGRDQKTEPFRFVATKSETGDLLFVEIEGGKDKDYVGHCPITVTDSVRNLVRISGYRAFEQFQRHHRLQQRHPPWRRRRPV